LSKRRQCIIDLVSEDSVIVEVGVWKGEFSNLLYNKKPKEMILIDPWKSFPELTGRWYSTTQKEMDRIYNQVKNRFSQCKNVKIIREFSLNVILDSKADLVYIDGNHSYESVKKDLNHWWSQINTGGYMTGDDFNWSDKHCKIGPKKAIEEFCKEKNAKLRVENNQWIIKK
jgi:hypothetical protein